MAGTMSGGGGEGGGERGGNEKEVSRLLEGEKEEGVTGVVLGGGGSGWSWAGLRKR